MGQKSSYRVFPDNGFSESPTRATLLHDSLNRITCPVDVHLSFNNSVFVLDFRSNHAKKEIADARIQFWGYDYWENAWRLEYRSRVSGNLRKLTFELKDSSASYLIRQNVKGFQKPEILKRLSEDENDLIQIKRSDNGTALKIKIKP